MPGRGVPWDISSNGVFTFVGLVMLSLCHLESDSEVSLAVQVSVTTELMIEMANVLKESVQRTWIAI